MPPQLSQPPLSVLEKLEITHGLLADILGRAPQLYDLHLDTALLLLVLAIKRARRSHRLRVRPVPDYPRYQDPEDLPF